MALKNKLFCPFNFGATPRHFIVDIAATLNFNIEKAIFHKKIISAFTFDIKGTFDRVIDRQHIKK